MNEELKEMQVVPAEEIIEEYLPEEEMEEEITTNDVVKTIKKGAILGGIAFGTKKAVEFVLPKVDPALHKVAPGVMKRVDLHKEEKETLKNSRKAIREEFKEKRHLLKEERKAAKAAKKDEEK